MPARAKASSARRPRTARWAPRVLAAQQGHEPRREDPQAARAAPSLPVFSPCTAVPVP